ncbi:MAG: adenylate/guanylate cyclase domain-containing protein [Gallionellaceae bacterium]|nr:adenylate/guanylate cyclase domain-containing protein [Gallionellaceae bacterium]
MDIVEYSKKSVAGQISLKERFNSFLSEAIRDVPVNERIILDTGDGAAISFLGDVEDALLAALSMRRSLESEVGRLDPPVLVRMGINLGPVRLVKDINGHPNIVGDGVNVAQRVMSFSAPGQILVSRSYFDAASRLSHDYVGMFLYLGSRTDKHVREHEVYEIGSPDENGKFQRHGSSSGDRNPFVAVLASRYQDLKIHLLSVFKQGSLQKKITYGLLLALPVLLSTLLMVKHFSKPSATSVAAVNNAQVEAATVTNKQRIELPRAVSGVANVEKSNAKKEKQQDVKNVVKPPKVGSKPEDMTAAEVMAKAKGGKSNQPVSSEDALSSTQGLITFSIRPWGEVYLDGKMIGVSPPLNKLKVGAGEHVIEVKNTNLPSHKETLKIKAGVKIIINHKFANS